MNFMSNYPTGVTGNEPQISGVHPIDSVVETVSGDLINALELIEDAMAYLDEQGYASKSDYTQADQVERILDGLITDIECKAEPPSEY